MTKKSLFWLVEHLMFISLKFTILIIDKILYNCAVSMKTHHQLHGLKKILVFRFSFFLIMLSLTIKPVYFQEPLYILWMKHRNLKFMYLVLLASIQHFLISIMEYLFLTLKVKTISPFFLFIHYKLILPVQPIGPSISLNVEFCYYNYWSQILTFPLFTKIFCYFNQPL